MIELNGWVCVVVLVGIVRRAGGCHPEGTRRSFAESGRNGKGSSSVIDLFPKTSPDFQSENQK